MRYQINATINSSARDFDALVRLLAESCESFELKKLDANGATPKRGGYRTTRYGRDTLLKIGKGVKPTRPQEASFSQLLTKHFDGKQFSRRDAGKYLRGVVPQDQRTSVSPVLTRLIDQKALEVIN